MLLNNLYNINCQIFLKKKFLIIYLNYDKIFITNNKIKLFKSNINP